MNTEFPRLLTLLRKEKGISQVQAAAELGISTSLMSHYERGKRECGLDFLVKCANYYGVSCDYLLGLSPERSGNTLTVEDIPDPETQKDTVFKGNMMPLLSRKLICNSMNVLFDLVAKTENPQLNREISAYLMIATYKMFRVVYGTNPKNEEAMFSVPQQMLDAYCNAAMALASCHADQIAQGNVDKSEIKNLTDMKLTTEYLKQAYPQYAPSLMNLIHNSEHRMAFQKNSSNE
ncbi:MAG: helix-turn-helix domain-containing protein [Oscillospiraceae bacterium]|nr:helix-turn-helix domain-containing protein [Oscillospiraceae bacterium]